MNRRFFKKRSLAETLRQVCLAKGDEFVWSGEPNSSHIARITGERQPTVNRWLNGTSSPTASKVKVLCKALKLSPSQLLGEEPIDYVDGKDVYLNESDYFARNFHRLPEKVQQSILFDMDLNLPDEPESRH